MTVIKRLGAAVRRLCWLDVGWTVWMGTGIGIYAAGVSRPGVASTCMFIFIAWVAGVGARRRRKPSSADRGVIR